MILGFLFFNQTFLKRCKALHTEKYKRYINILLLLIINGVRIKPNKLIQGNTINYRKIPKISPGAYIFKGPENLRFKIDWASPIVGRKFTVFALFYFVFGGNFQVQAPGGLMFGGAI